MRNLKSFAVLKIMAVLLIGMASFTTYNTAIAKSKTISIDGGKLNVTSDGKTLKGYILNKKAKRSNVAKLCCTASCKGYNKACYGKPCRRCKSFCKCDSVMDGGIDPAVTKGR